jgi:hypothetical protein
MSQIQAVLFNRDYWTIPHAYTWLHQHGLIPMKKAHLTKYYYHFRIRDPKEFSRIRTKKISNDIDLLIGFY